MNTGQLGTIERWHAAVNDGDAAGAGALCTADVEVGGPRGSGFGRELVVEWVGHSGPTDLVGLREPELPVGQ